MTQTFHFDIWEDEAPVILTVNFPDFEAWEDDELVPVLVVGGSGVIFIRRRAAEF